MAKKHSNKEKVKKSIKPLFRSAVQENAEKYFDKDFNELNHQEISRCMTRTYVESINKHKYPEIMPLEEDDYENCDSDGPGDLNIDFICRENSTVVIIQSKYHKKGSKNKTENRADFVDFCEVLKRLHNGSYKGNEKVNEIARDIDWENDKFILEFNALSKDNDAIRTRESDGHYTFDDLPKGFEERVDIVFNDEEDLNSEYRSYLDWTKGIDHTVEVVPVQIEENSCPWLISRSNDGEREAYIGVINGKQLRELYKPKTVQNKLFAENIRNPMGVSKGINKEIRKTGIEHSNEFFFFNNGISAIAYSIKMDEKTGSLNCEGLSVINGAQTILSLVKTSRTLSENDLLGDTQVLIRITKVSKSQKDKEMKFTRNVIRYNNTQNKIVASDFCSNEPIQLDLEKKFSCLKTVDGKSFCYLRKRTDTKGERDIIKVTKESFAKNIHSFLYGSPEMFGGLNKLFDSTSNDGRYAFVFGDEKNAYESYEEKEFLKLAGIYFFSNSSLEELKKEKEKRIKEEEENPDKKPVIRNALYSKTLFVFTLGTLLRARYRELNLKLDDDLVRIGKPKWMEKDGDVKKNIQLYTQATATILICTYSAASQRPGFAHRSWFRKQTTLDEIRDQTDNLAAPYGNLVGIVGK